MGNTDSDITAWITPFLVVADPARSLAFHERAFGFERSFVNEEDGAIVHAELARDGATVLFLTKEGVRSPADLSPATSSAACPAELVIHVRDVDGTFARCLECGAVPVFEPKDVPWGERLALIADPDGYRWLLTAP
jgi:lactoylglutathione lyase